MDYQRVHPVGVTSPSAPAADVLQPEELATKSRNASAHTDTLPLYTAPVTSSPPPETNRPQKKRSRWCRCFCWTFLALILLIIVLAAIVGILYLIFRPKIPHYSVDNLNVTSFSLNNNLTAEASFDVTVTSRNPNKRIGLYYLDGSEITAWYNTTQLCNGSYPVFYQGHRNTTVVHLLLSGKPTLTNELVSGVQSQLATGSIPILVRGHVPVKIKFGALKLFKITGKIRCSLMLDSSTASSSGSNVQLKFRSSSCSVKVKL